MSDIYGNDLKGKEEARLEKANLSEENKKLIKTFVDYKIAERGIAPTRAAKIMWVLRSISERFLDGMSYANLERADIVRIVAQIEQDGEMKAWTKRDYKLIMRMLLLWLGKDAAWVKVTPPRADIQPEDMLTPDEVDAMIDAAISLRDKAFIATLFEGGFRIAELATARVKDAVIDAQGAILMVRGKTGLRRVRLVTSTPHLSQWINAHPERDNRDAPLWVYTDRPGGMKYQAIRVQLVKIAKKAGVKKKVNPHNFRHSRATYLASRLTEAQLEEYLGWVHGSDSPRTYVHMSGRDVDAAIMEMHGLGHSEKKSESTVKKCPFCETMNSIESKICYLCKRPLEITAEGVLNLEDEVKELRKELNEMKTKAAAFDISALLEGLKENPEAQDVIVEMLTQKIVSKRS
jgi:integrase/recombinase XerD